MARNVAEWLLENEEKWEYDVVTNSYITLSEDVPEEVKEYFEKKNKLLKLLKGGM